MRALKLKGLAEEITRHIVCILWVFAERCSPSLQRDDDGTRRELYER